MNRRISIAIGPELTEFGSWNWIGKGLLDSLGPQFDTSVFSDVHEIRYADVIVFIKFKPPLDALKKLRQSGTQCVFIPIDVYGSAAEIDGDVESLKQLNLVLVHSHRLLRFFQSHCVTAYLDHPLKFVLPVPRASLVEGPLLWIGRRCNLQPVVDWFNQAAPKQDLWILTNTEGSDFQPQSAGFHEPRRVRGKTWSEHLHLEWLAHAGLAIDVKGNDFRSRHKPPAKAFDYLASGIPVLTNRGSSTAIEMTRRGLTPLTTDAWNVDAKPLTTDTRHHYASAVRQWADPDNVWNCCRELLMNTVQDGVPDAES